MRILQINIRNWRNFNNLEIEVPEDAPIVCLVGGNGTGKSQILEVIGAAAHHLGLSAGYAGARGDAFAERADIEVRFQIAKGVFPSIEELERFGEGLHQALDAWDRTITISNSVESGMRLSAGNIAEPGLSHQFAQHIAALIRESKDVHYLMLDADRAYPRIDVGTHQIGEAFQRNWAVEAKSRSFMLAKSLYEEWFRYLLGTEGQNNNRFVQSIRLARDANEKDPEFVDTMAGYRDSIRVVLPHLLFTGIDATNRQVLFDAAGTALGFDQLSGGEREIAFLVGQIERFNLRRGLLMVDEPELHLNNDLLRNWIGFLKGSVEQGQIWLASHSIEVVEVTGQDATFVLEREQESRRVSSAKPIAGRPVVATLSRALGSPAFSIRNLSFVLIEGEETIGERERYRLICPDRGNVRFIEAGNCRDVIRRLDSLRLLAAASGEPLSIGGVVDRDHRSISEISEIESAGVHVLKVQEVENFFLHPETVMAVMVAISQPADRYESILQTQADERAGAWIFDAARTDRAFREFTAPSSETKEMVHLMTWSDFVDKQAAIDRITASEVALSVDEKALLARHLAARAKSYERIRVDGSLWKRCDGKEIFQKVANSIGFADASAAERAIAGMWKSAKPPAELVALRRYLDQVHAYGSQVAAPPNAPRPSPSPRAHPP